jgi:hypothetical protein
MNGQGETLRLFEFTPVRGAFDSILRDVMIPDLWTLPGVLQVYVGRQGPDEVGPRLVASTWESEEAMVDALGVSFDAPRFHPEFIDETSARRLEFLPLSFSYHADTMDPPAIIRLVTGQVRPDELEAYVGEAWAGTENDAAAGRGPMALSWRPGPRPVPDPVRLADWATLQDATGGDIDRPIATRHARRSSTGRRAITRPSPTSSDIANLRWSGRASRQTSTGGNVADTDPSSSHQGARNAVRRSLSGSRK